MPVTQLPNINGLLTTNDVNDLLEAGAVNDGANDCNLENFIIEMGSYAIVGLIFDDLANDCRDCNVYANKKTLASIKLGYYGEYNSTLQYNTYPNTNDEFVSAASSPNSFNIVSCTTKEQQLTKCTHKAVLWWD